MTNVYDFDAARQDYQTQAGNAIGEAEHSPDDASQAFVMSKATGVPASIIADNKDDFSKVLKTKLASTILSDNPPLTAFTNSNPLHPSLIQDDISKLDDVSKSLDKARWNPFEEGFKAYAQAHEAYVNQDQSAFDAAAHRLAKGALRGRLEVPTRPVPIDYATWGNFAERVERNFPHPPEDIRDVPNWIRDNPDAINSLLGMVFPAAEPNTSVFPRGKVQEFIDLADRIQATQRAQKMGEAVQEGARAAEAAQPPQLALPSPEQLSAVVEEFEKVKPWAEAGVEPLPTISTAADWAKEQQAKIEQEALKDVVDAASASELKERNPEKFDEFVGHHPDSIVSISPDAIAQNPEAFKWLGPTGAGKVDVPMSQFLAHFDKEDWPLVKDDISLGGLTKNDIATIKEAPTEPVVGDTLDQIRAATGLTAFHGTPADFQKFALEFMSTGEGAQSFGPGHYFSEERAVAEEYQKNLARTELVDHRGQPIELDTEGRALFRDVAGRFNGDIDYAIKEMNRWKVEDEFPARGIDEMLRQLNNWKSQGASIRQKGNLLQVALDANPNLMLDWDKPLGEQTLGVQGIVKKLGVKAENVQGMLEELRDRGASPVAIADEEASEKRWRGLPAKLSEAGLHGTRYLDQGSRNKAAITDLKRALEHWKESDAPEAAQRMQEVEQAIRAEEAKPQTSNYVIFDDKRIKITHKNGEPVPEALRRQVLERGRSGRPVSTGKLALGSEADILDFGLERALPESAPGPFAGGKAMGVSERLYQNLLNRIQKVTTDDAKWRARRAEAQAKLERSEAWKAERARLEPEVRAKIENMGMVAAWERLRKIKLDPAFVRPAERSDIPELVGLGGIRPDDAAGMFDYPSGQDLINDLRGLAAEAKAGKGNIVDRLVNKQLDLMVKAKLGKTPLERLDEEIDHALSLTTLELLHEKIVTMGEQIGTKVPLSKYAMNWGSKQELESKLFKGLNARRLLGDVIVEAKKVQRALAADKPQEAFLGLQNQYNLTIQARIMREVEKEAKGFDRIAKRFRNREVSNFPIEHANFIQQILMGVGQRVDRSPLDLARSIALVAQGGGAKDLDSFVTRLVDEEGWIAPVASFLRDGTAKPLAKMNVGEARALFDSVRTIVKRGTAEAKVEAAGRVIDFKDVRDELVDMVAQVGPAKPRALSENPKNIFNLIKTAHYSMLSTEVFVDRLNEFRPTNLMTELYINPLIDGFYKRDAAIREFSKELNEALGKIKNPRGEIKNDLFFDPDLYKRNGTIVYPKMNREDFYAVLANLGNESNAAKLAGGYNIIDYSPEGKPDIARVRNWAYREVAEGRAFPEDFDKMQAYGKITAKLKDMADAAALKESDVPAENVPLEGFDAPWGKHYDGWYHRLTPHEYWEGAPQAADSVELESKDYTRAATPRRYEKQRTDAKYPLSFDFQRVVRASINEQLHDIYLRGPVREMAKLLRDEKFRNALRTHYSKPAIDNMVEWLKSLSNSAARENAVDGAIMAGVRAFRRNVVGNALNFNPSTVVKHGSTAAVRSFITVGPDFLLSMAKLFTPIRFFMNKNINHVMSTSNELPNRADFWEHTVSGSVSKSFGEWNLTKIWNKLGRNPVAFSDWISTAGTYHGQWVKTFRQTGDEDLARIAADKAVVEAHGSMNLARRPRMMGRNPVWEMFTSFMNFFSTIYQSYYKGSVHAELGWQSMADGKWKKGFDHFYGGVFPYIIATAVSIAVADYLAKRAMNTYKEAKSGLQGKIQRAGEALHPFAAPIPILNQIVEAMEQGGDSAFGIAASGVNEVMRAVREAAKAIDEATHHGRLSKKTTSTLIQQGGGALGNVLGGFPGRAPARSAANIHRLATNQYRPKTGWDLFWYLMGGREKPPKR